MNSEKIKQSAIILMADDNEDDFLLAQRAFQKAQVLNELRWVQDGQELMEYLLHQGKYQDLSLSPRPGLILLDLNMPRKDGRKALEEIKQNPQLKEIPVIILTMSDLEEDVIKCYQLGANSFIRKPIRFENFVEVIRSLSQYWLKIVELPPSSYKQVS